MGIIKYTTSNIGGGIPAIGSWDLLATLEPAAENTQRIITGGVSGATLTGDCLVKRGATNWYLPSSDETARAYMLYNPIPAPTYNPFRSHIYLAPAAGHMEEQTFGQRSISVIMPRVSKASFSWSSVRLYMADITGTPVAPEGVWFGLQDVDGDNPQYIESWVAATGLVAPPAGTVDSPGIGPVCNLTTLAGSTSTKAIVVRIQMPAGTYTKGKISTGASLIPDYVSRFGRVIDGPITSDPGTWTGWGEAFGEMPWFVLQVAGLSVPQCVIGGIGDSHMQGYRADAGGQGTRGMLGEMYSLYQTTENLFVTNFAKSGDNISQISSKLHAFEAALDIGGWLHQRASINDRDGSNDITTTQANLTYDALVADYSYLSGLNKIMIPIQSAGFDDGATGWYGRYTARQPDEIAAWPAHMYNASSILNSDGSYQTDMGGPDGGHPSELGYQTWAGPSWTSLIAALTSFGVTL